MNMGLRRAMQNTSSEEVCLIEVIEKGSLTWSLKSSRSYSKFCCSGGFV